MAIGVKAVFNYSATAGVTTAWSLTASTSIAINDVLVLSMAWRTSATASHTISAISDNAGNAWTRIVENASTGFNTAMFYAVVASTTANYQVALAPAGNKTVSARAAHILVLTGVDTSNPLDGGAVATNALLASTATTATLSTSVSTSLANEFLVVSAHQNNIASATMAADAAWTLQGNVIGAAGGAQNVKKYLWTRAVGAPAIYQWSASLSNGGGTRTRIFQIAAFKPAVATGSASATATLDFAPAGTLNGAGSASVAAVFGFTPSAILAGAGSASAGAVVAFGSTALLAGNANPLGASNFSFATSGQLVAAGAIEAAATLGFGPTGTVGSEAASAAAALPPISTLLGGGWDRRLFRKLLEAHRCELRARACRMATEGSEYGPDGEAGTGASASAIASRLAVLNLAPLRQMWRLREQAETIAVLGDKLQTLSGAIDSVRREREAEDLLLLAA